MNTSKFGLSCLVLCLFNGMFQAESPTASKKKIKKKVAADTSVKKMKKHSTSPKAAPTIPSKIEEVPPPPPLMREISSEEEIPAPPPLPSENLIFLAAELGAEKGSTLEVIERLINQGSGSVHDRNDKGQTPLMVAIEHNNDQTVKDLLDLGSDRTAQDAAGHSVLWYVEQQKNPSITKLFKSTSTSSVPVAPPAPQAPEAPTAPMAPSAPQAPSEIPSLPTQQTQTPSSSLNTPKSTPGTPGTISSADIGKKLEKLKPASERKLAPAKKEEETDLQRRVRKYMEQRRTNIESEPEPESDDDDNDWGD